MTNQEWKPQMSEKMVFVSPEEGIFRTICEMENTPDPDTKIFRFKAWPGKWPNAPYYPSGIKDDGSGPRGRVRSISVFSYWNDEFDVGEIVGRYRVTTTMDAPDAYIAAYEGTTRPEPVRVVESDPAMDNDARRTRLVGIEDKIMYVLDKTGRMVLAALKRKTHAYRFGEDWDTCLQTLAQQGELETQTDDAGRVWVSTTTVAT